MSTLDRRLNAIRERRDTAFRFPTSASKQAASATDVLPLLEAVEAVLEKCDDYLKWERKNPREPFEFGMAEAARDMQSILAEKLGEDDE